MITVRVDFRVQARDGLVRSSVDRADGPVKEGDRVRVVNFAEGKEFEADVESLEDGRLYLRVHWDRPNA